ncbi:MAG: hypothetical protein J3K34DRAFT_499179, partial [Monoraphidium minutum]
MTLIETAGADCQWGTGSGEALACVTPADASAVEPAPMTPRSGAPLSPRQHAPQPGPPGRALLCENLLVQALSWLDPEDLAGGAALACKRWMRASGSREVWRRRMHPALLRLFADPKSSELLLAPASGAVARQQPLHWAPARLFRAVYCASLLENGDFLERDNSTRALTLCGTGGPLQGGRACSCGSASSGGGGGGAARARGPRREPSAFAVGCVSMGGGGGGGWSEVSQEVDLLEALQRRAGLPPGQAAAALACGALLELTFWVAGGARAGGARVQAVVALVLGAAARAAAAAQLPLAGAVAAAVPFLEDEEPTPDLLRGEAPCAATRAAEAGLRKLGLPGAVQAQVLGPAAAGPAWARVRCRVALPPPPEGAAAAAPPPGGGRRLVIVLRGRAGAGGCGGAGAAAGVARGHALAAPRMMRSYAGALMGPSLMAGHLNEKSVGKLMVPMAAGRRYGMHIALKKPGAPRHVQTTRIAGKALATSGDQRLCACVSVLQYAAALLAAGEHVPRVMHDLLEAKDIDRLTEILLALAPNVPEMKEIIKEIKDAGEVVGPQHHLHDSFIKSICHAAGLLCLVVDGCSVNLGGDLSKLRNEVAATKLLSVLYRGGHFFSHLPEEEMYIVIEHIVDAEAFKRDGVTGTLVTKGFFTKMTASGDYLELSAAVVQEAINTVDTSEPEVVLGMIESLQFAAVKRTSGGGGCCAGGGTGGGAGGGGPGPATRPGAASLAGAAGGPGPVGGGPTAATGRPIGAATAVAFTAAAAPPPAPPGPVRAPAAAASTAAGAAAPGFAPAPAPAPAAAASTAPAPPGPVRAPAATASTAAAAPPRAPPGRVRAPAAAAITAAAAAAPGFAPAPAPAPAAAASTAPAPPGPVRAPAATASTAAAAPPRAPPGRVRAPAAAAITAAAAAAPGFAPAPAPAPAAAASTAAAAPPRAPPGRVRAPATAAFTAAAVPPPAPPGPVRAPAAAASTAAAAAAPGFAPAPAPAPAAAASTAPAPPGPVRAPAAAAATAAPAADAAAAAAEMAAAAAGVAEETAPPLFTAQVADKPTPVPVALSPTGAAAYSVSSAVFKAKMLRLCASMRASGATPVDISADTCASRGCGHGAGIGRISAAGSAATQQLGQPHGIPLSGVAAKEEGGSRAAPAAAAAAAPAPLGPAAAAGAGDGAGVGGSAAPDASAAGAAPKKRGLFGRLRAGLCAIIRAPRGGGGRAASAADAAASTEPEDAPRAPGGAATPDVPRPLERPPMPPCRRCAGGRRKNRGAGVAGAAPRRAAGNDGSHAPSATHAPLDASAACAAGGSRRGGEAGARAGATAGGAQAARGAPAPHAAAGAPGLAAASAAAAAAAAPAPLGPAAAAGAGDGAGVGGSAAPDASAAGAAPKKRGLFGRLRAGLCAIIRAPRGGGGRAASAADAAASTEPEDAPRAPGGAATPDVPRPLERPPMPPCRRCAGGRRKNRGAGVAGAAPRRAAGNDGSHAPSATHAPLDASAACAAGGSRRGGEAGARAGATAGGAQAARGAPAPHAAAGAPGLAAASAAAAAAAAPAPLGPAAAAGAGDGAGVGGSAAPDASAAGAAPKKRGLFGRLRAGLCAIIRAPRGGGGRAASAADAAASTEPEDAPRAPGGAPSAPPRRFTEEQWSQHHVAVKAGTLRASVPGALLTPSAGPTTGLRGGGTGAAVRPTEAAGGSSGRPASGAGLENLGNTCYLNAVIQALAFLPPLARQCRARAHRDLCNTQGAPCVFCDFEIVVNRVLAASGAHSPDALVKALPSLNSDFKPYVQQDAHELLRCLLEELSRIQNAALEHAVMTTGVLPPPRCPGPSVIDMFSGTLFETVRCLECGDVCRQRDKSQDLSLSIDNADSVEEALVQYTREEPLETRTCDKCGRDMPASKQTTMRDPPHALVIHLKRFNANGTVVTKNSRHVKFGERLDIAPFLDKNQTPAGASVDGTTPIKGSYGREADVAAGGTAAAACLPSTYRLCSVVVHAGDKPSSGHYYSFVRGSGGWHRANDEVVTRVPWSAVEQEDAYMLFYARADAPHSADEQASATSCVAAAEAAAAPAAAAPSAATSVAPAMHLAQAPSAEQQPVPVTRGPQAAPARASRPPPGAEHGSGAAGPSTGGVLSPARPLRGVPVAAPVLSPAALKTLALSSTGPMAAMMRLVDKTQEMLDRCRAGAAAGCALEGAGAAAEPDAGAAAEPDGAAGPGLPARGGGGGSGDQHASASPGVEPPAERGDVRGAAAAAGAEGAMEAEEGGGPAAPAPDPGAGEASGARTVRQRRAVQTPLDPEFEYDPIAPFYDNDADSDYDADADADRDYDDDADGDYECGYYQSPRFDCRLPYGAFALYCPACPLLPRAPRLLSTNPQLLPPFTLHPSSPTPCNPRPTPVDVPATVPAPSRVQLEAAALANADAMTAILLHLRVQAEELARGRARTPSAGATNGAAAGCALEGAGAAAEPDAGAAAEPDGAAGPGLPARGGGGGSGDQHASASPGPERGDDGGGGGGGGRRRSGGGGDGAPSGSALPTPPPPGAEPPAERGGVRGAAAAVGEEGAMEVEEGGGPAAPGAPGVVPVRVPSGGMVPPILEGHCGFVPLMTTDQDRTMVANDKCAAPAIAAALARHNNVGSPLASRRGKLNASRTSSYVAERMAFQSCIDAGRLPNAPADEYLVTLLNDIAREIAEGCQEGGDAIVDALFARVYFDDATMKAHTHGNPTFEAYPGQAKDALTLSIRISQQPTSPYVIVKGRSGPSVCLELPSFTFSIQDGVALGNFLVTTKTKSLIRSDVLWRHAVGRPASGSSKTLRGQPGTDVTLLFSLKSIKNKRDFAAAALRRWAQIAPYWTPLLRAAVAAVQKQPPINDVSDLTCDRPATMSVKPSRQASTFLCERVADLLGVPCSLDIMNEGEVLSAVQDNEEVKRPGADERTDDQKRAALRLAIAAATERKGAERKRPGWRPLPARPPIGRFAILHLLTAPIAAIHAVLAKCWCYENRRSGFSGEDCCRALAGVVTSDVFAAAQLAWARLREKHLCFAHELANEVARVLKGGEKGMPIEVVACIIYTAVARTTGIWGGLTLRRRRRWRTDRAAVEMKGGAATLNFPLTNYLDDLDEETRAGVLAQAASAAERAEAGGEGGASKSGPSSQFRGVSHTRGGRWEARIMRPAVDGGKPKRKKLGRFATKEQAAVAHDRAAVEMKGGAATLNFPLTNYLDDLDEGEGRGGDAGRCPGAGGVGRRAGRAGGEGGASKSGPGSQFRGVSCTRGGRWEVRISLPAVDGGKRREQ